MSILKKRLKRTEKTKFICTSCGVSELIPTKVVRMMDQADPSDNLGPPTFFCEKCNGIMMPTDYIDCSGIRHRLDDEI